MNTLAYRRFDACERGGRLAALEPVADGATPAWAVGVGPAPETAWRPATEPDSPFFASPIPFVIAPPAGADEPFYAHNHCPTVTWCPNGDLLAAWFSTVREVGTEMTILASRLRAGAAAWDPAAEFFKAPDRNMTGTALFHDGRGTIFHFNGMGPAGVEGWDNLVVLLRTSSDNGASWTPPRVISPGARYRSRNQVIAGTSVTPGGALLQACDGTSGGEGPTALHVSRDGGRTWRDPGGDIRGIHAGVVGLRDGRLLAFGRSQALEGRMPVSVSEDLGASWQSRPGPFPPISWSQRLALLRLREGPLLLASFTNFSRRGRETMTFADHAGRAFDGLGLYVALSLDEGASWPVRKLLTPCAGPPGDLARLHFTATPTEAEPAGYLAVTQAPDDVINLVSSRLHYRFNLAWLLQPCRIER